MRPHDDPHEIARKFCIANSLDPEIEEKISAYIINNLPSDKRTPMTKSTESPYSKLVSSHRSPQKQDMSGMLKSAFDTASKCGTLTCQTTSLEGNQRYMSSLYDSIVHDPT